MRARVVAALVAVTALVVGALGTFGLLVLDEETRRPGSFGSGPALAAVPLLLFVSLLTFFASVGVVATPTRVVERGARRPFVAGVALAGLAIASALVVQLFFITWPLAIALGACSLLCFVTVSRRMRAG